MKDLVKRDNLEKIQTIHQLEGIETLGAIVEDGFGIKTLNIDKRLGKGTVKTFDFKNGMAVDLFDLQLFDNFTVTLHHDTNEYLYFFYGIDGICYHNFKGKEKYTIIDELQTVIIGGNKNAVSEVTIKKNLKFNFIVITIDKELYFKRFQKKYSPPENKVAKLRKAFNELNNYVYHCSHNLKVAEQIRLLRNNSVEFNISYLMYFKSYFQLIFLIQVEQFYKEVYEERLATSLTKTELQKVRKITEYIIDNPSLNHSIKKLCFQSLLSPVKLQEGFRCLHGTTVSNYIKNIRVDKARDLLIYSDHNVSEIAYMVGFASRSYFCKIFKEKFGLNALAYKEKYKDKTVVV